MRTTPLLAPIVLSLVATCSNATEPTGRQDETARGARLALLVGVTRYQNFPSLLLEGPANDVILIRQMLMDRFGFQDPDIVILSEAEGERDPTRLPTRANIEREMIALVKKVVEAKEAKVVVYLSGHGARQPDLLREPADVKPDGMSEVFLPTDFAGWDMQSKRLKNSVIDFELRNWLKDIRANGARVWAIIDSCHSGTMARGLATARKVDVRDPRLGLAVPPEAFAEAVKRGRANTEKDMPARAPIDEPGLVAVYASLPYESTFDDTFPFYPKDEKEVPRKYGVLTWHLGEVFNDVTGSDPDMTYVEMIKRVQAKYRRNNIDHPTPLVEGLDRNERVLWSKAGPRVTKLFLTKLPNGALKVNAGRLHGLTENSILAVYPPTGPISTESSLGDVVLTRVGDTESDVANWDESKAADFQENQYKPLMRAAEGGERCEPLFLAYGDLKLKVAVANVDGEGQEVAPEARLLARRTLDQLTDEAKPYVSIVDAVEHAQWLVRTTGNGMLELVRREGMKTGPLSVPSKPSELSNQLVKIARAQMLIQLETGDLPPDEASIKAGEAIAFDIDLLRQAGGVGEFRPVPLASGDGAVFHVGDRLQLKFTNQGLIDADITVLQVDQDYEIIPLFPGSSGGVQNRLRIQNEIQSNDKALYTTRPRVTEDGVTRFKDPSGDQRGLHCFVIIAVRGQGDPVDFRGLATNGEGFQARGDHRAVRRARPVLNALQGKGDTRNGLDTHISSDYVVRVLRWEVIKPAK